MPMRPLSSTLIIRWKPRPSGPSSAPAVSFTSWKSSAPTCEARWPILCSLRPTSKPGESRSTRKMLMPRWPARRVGAREHAREVAHRRVVDPELAAGERPAVGGARRRAAQVREIGAGLSFGERIGTAAFGLEQRPQVALVLLGRAVRGEQRPDELHQPALVGDRGVAARELLHHDRVGERVAARAAERFRDRDAEEAEAGHLRVQLGGKALRLVELARDRPDALVGEPAHRVADLQVALGEERRRHVSGGSHFMTCSPTTASSPPSRNTSTFERLRPLSGSSSRIV